MGREIMDEAFHLRQELAKWKNRTLECAQRACEECSEYTQKNCEKCRIKKIREEALE